MILLQDKFEYTLGYRRNQSSRTNKRTGKDTRAKIIYKLSNGGNI